MGWCAELRRDVGAIKGHAGEVRSAASAGGGCCTLRSRVGEIVREREIERIKEGVEDAGEGARLGAIGEGRLLEELRN